MSVFDDSESEAGYVKKGHFNEEEWGDDVSIISRYEGSTASVVIFKVVLALVLIGLCSGALVYSIINSERLEEDEYILPDNFPIDNSQECNSGSLLLVSRTGNYTGNTEEYNTTQYDCSWVQDASKKRIYHRVGLTVKNWQYTFFVFENTTFYQNKTGCMQIHTGMQGDMIPGYYGFLNSLGLSYIGKYRTEQILINGGFREVEVYEGEPPSDVTVGGGDHPSLIRGYADMNQPLIYGWELYFAHSYKYPLFKQEYFFPSMSRHNPNFAVFDDMPSECFSNL